MSQNKSQPRVSVRVVKSQSQPVEKALAPTQVSREETSNASEWITPPYDMRGLRKLVTESTILPQCTRAYRNNIPGYGIGVRYKDDVEETEEMAAEFARAVEIIDLLSLDMDTKEVFEDIIEAREMYGIAYLEVIRNIGGEVSQIEFISDTPSVTKTVPLEPYIETEVLYKGNKQKRLKKFMKYRQRLGGKTVYFKEFGDKRIMDKRTGAYVDELDIPYQANEIIEFAIGTEPYGEVRWTGQTLSVDGMRRAEFLNNNYFRNGRHTPLMILVKGGTLSDESFDKLQNYIDGIKGEEGQHAFLLLETESTDNSVEFEGAKPPDVEVKDLASILQQDELFQSYLDNGRKKVQSAFLLPDLYVGYTTDFNRATAQTAMEVTEKQVFQPERKSLAWVVNNKLLSEFGFKYVEAYFLEPDTSNPDDLVKILSICNQAGGLTPNKAKQVVYEALGEVSEDYPDDWGEIPLAYSKTQVQPQQMMTGVQAQIEKAAANHDDEIIPVLKELRDYFRKTVDFSAEYGIIKDVEKEWDESKHPRDESGKFTGSGVSPSGANTLEVRGFANKQKANNHWTNGRTHRDEYEVDGIKTVEQYEARAVELLESATSETILGHADGHGNIIRYDTEKNDYVKGSPQKGVKTMFKPTEGKAYYESMRKGDLDNGGKT